MTYAGGLSVPGSGAAEYTFENEVRWGGDAGKGLNVHGNAQIVSTTVDATNSPTSILRPGLVMARLDASPEDWTDYDPDATDGSQIARGVLTEEVRMTDFSGTARNRVGRIMRLGLVRASRLYGLDLQARKQLKQAFRFDDDVISGRSFLADPYVNEEVTSDTTLTAADAGKRLIATTADVDFTLPALATNPGFSVEVLRASDHEMAVISAEGNNMIVGNDLSATSVTFTTAGDQIGVRCQIEAIYVGTTPKWLFKYFEPVLGTGLGGVIYAIA